MAKPARHCHGDMAGTTTERRFEMNAQMKKLFMLIVALGVLFTATAITAPAQAGPPLQQRVSISTDRGACTVSAKATWRNYDPATFYYAQLVLFHTDGTTVWVEDASTSPSGTTTLTTDSLSVEAGQTYYAQLHIASNGDHYFESKTVTLVCR
jgi:hypothetical protein